MTPDVPDIVIVDRPIDRDVLRTLVDRHFEGMVKYVVDVERGVAAVGGEQHADAKALLVEHGSRVEYLWGASYYPGRGPEACVEYTSLINVRPSQGNGHAVVENEALRARIREITFALIGRGEALAGRSRPGSRPNAGEPARSWSNDRAPESNRLEQENDESQS